jgi:hypothetical protein
MTHAALVNNALLLIVVLMTLLLVMFLCAVIWTDLEPVGAPEPPVLKPPVPPRPRAATSGAAARSGGAGYAARHANAAVPMQNVIHRPEVSGRPPWDPLPNGQNVIHRPEVWGEPPWGPAPKPASLHRQGRWPSGG